MRTKHFVSSIALLVLTACEEKSDLCYQPGGACASDARSPDAAVIACMGPAECATTPTTPFCDSTTRTCVGCSASQQCVDLAGTADICLKEGGAVFGECVVCDEDDRQAPNVGMTGDECQTVGLHVCDGTSHTCRECRSNSECASGVCEAPSCITAGEVIYVTPTGVDNPTCSASSPCASLRGAVAAINATRRFVLIAPGEYTDVMDADLNNKSATIIATGATLRRTGSGPLITVRGDSVVTLVDGILDATGAGAEGISTSTNTQLSLLGTTVKGAATSGVAAAGRLTVRRARLEGNGTFGVTVTSSGPFELTRSTLIRNGSGGLSLSAQTAVVMSNYFVKNGLANSLPALQITSLSNPNASRIEFNTIAGNVADSGSAAGAASCPTSTIVLRNSVLYFNNGIAQVSVCTVRYSSVQGATPDAVNGVINDNPSFINTGGDNFGLMPASAVAGKADPAADLTGAAAVDFDGQMRPLGGAAADLGADEIP